MMWGDGVADGPVKGQTEEVEIDDDVERWCSGWCSKKTNGGS